MGAENALYAPLGPFEVLTYSEGLKVSTVGRSPAEAPLEIIRMNENIEPLRPMHAQVDVRHESGRYTVTVSQAGEVRVDQHFRDKHGNHSYREITAEGQHWRARLAVLSEARRRLQAATDAIPLPFEDKP